MQTKCKEKEKRAMEELKKKKKTKIICTLGPNSDNPEIMRGLAENGMDVARFNFSHGSYSAPTAPLELLKQVRVSTPTDTRIVAITVEDTEPAQAMQMANCIREVASSHIQNVMDIEAVNVVEPANMPTVKASPNVSVWTFIGGMLGVLLICFIVIVRYLLDDTIKSSEDVEKYLGLSTLALIPIAENGEKAKTNKKKRK